MSAIARRRQTPITIRSERAASRLALLTRDGRSQAQVIEEALDRMPLPTVGDRDATIAEIKALLAAIPQRPYPTMAEIDREFYDDEGLPI